MGGRQQQLNGVEYAQRAASSDNELPPPIPERRPSSEYLCNGLSQVSREHIIQILSYSIVRQH